MESDPISTFVSTKQFFDAVRDRDKLGSVVNGNQYDDEYCDSDDDTREKPEYIKNISNAMGVVFDDGDARYASFCVQGSIDVTPQKNNPEVTLMFDDEAKMSVDASDELIDDLPTLINKYFEPAKFGDKNQKTVYDPKVRTAYQCNLSDKCSFAQNGTQTQHPDFLRRIWTNINQYLIDNNGCFDFTPYKCNVYTKGGFFVPHKDTPIDHQNSIGTLVIGIPITHDGGDLLVRHQGLEDSFYVSQAPNEISWIAFFTDCEHEVKKITSGFRVTCTYNIVKTKHVPNWAEFTSDVKGLYGENLTSCSPGPSIRHIAEDQLLESIKKSERKHLGLFLSHEYTLGNIDTNNLKGDDKALYDTVSKQYKCRVSCVLYDYKKYSGFEGERSEVESVYDVYEVDIDDWKAWITKGKLPDKKTKSKYIFILTVGEGSWRLLDSSAQQAGYTGNEGCEGEECRLYFAAVLLIDNPEAQYDGVYNMVDTVEDVKYVFEQERQFSKNSEGYSEEPEERKYIEIKSYPVKTDTPKRKMIVVESSSESEQSEEEEDEKPIIKPKKSFLLSSSEDDDVSCSDSD